ncbi:DUF192 domain-containing protein [Sphingomonas sp. ASV193]|uniref:DUF192 domain-containing protein n=1 Tax=Sphingomonas sp. ASV193 TaxID=3144405 RepID=UPI0032E8CB25
MAGAIAACSPSGNAASATMGQSPAGLAEVPLTVTTAAGKTEKFTVEVAKTPAEQEKGLMFRQQMAPDHGMIFPYDPPVSAIFWMKNTYIPLDLVFVRANGTIARIEENAVPLSEDQIPAGEPIAAVLEINGGRSAQLGIKAGDRVSWQH